MDLKLLQRQGEFAWEIPRHGAMRVPGMLYASEQVGGMVAWLEVVGERCAFAFALPLTDGFELLAALGDQLVFVLGRVGGIVFRHGAGT